MRVAQPQYGMQKGYGMDYPVDKPIDRWAGNEVYSRKPQTRSRGNCCQKFCCCFFTILIALSLTAFFIFPRIPDVTLSDPVFTESVQSLRSEGDAFKASANAPFKLLFDLSIEITSISENYIDWNMDAIRIDGAIQDVKTKRISQAAVAQGVATDAVIKKLSTSVISLPITVSYTSLAPIQSLATDPEFLALIAPCGFGEGNSPQPMSLKYRVEIELGWLKRFYTPSFEGNVNFPCPLTEDQLTQIIIGSGGQTA
jgi:hypothetical protein